MLVVPITIALLETLIPMLLIAWSAGLRYWQHSYFGIDIVCIVALVLAVTGRTCTVPFVQSTMYIASSASWSFLIFLLCIPLLHALANLNWLQAVTCVCAGYTMQNLASGLVDFIVQRIAGAHSYRELMQFYADQYVYVLMLSVLVDAAVYVICYFLIVRTLREESLLMITDARVLVVLVCVMIAVILFDVVIKHIQLDITDTVSATVLRLVHMLICVFVLYAEFELLSRHAIMRKLIQNETLLAQRTKQWQTSRDNREALQMQMHDLKHVLLGSTAKARLSVPLQQNSPQQSISQHSISQQGISQLDISIQAQDSIMKRIAALEAYAETGNIALDTVLSEKALVCQRHNIRLTTMIQADAIAHLAAADVYVLFGNILDNAIEAAAQVASEQERVIAVKIRHSGAMSVILVENSYTGTVRFAHDRPVTTKAQPQLHGFGAQSIATIVHQYHGSVQFSANDHIFTVAILLPSA